MRTICFPLFLLLSFAVQSLHADGLDVWTIRDSDPPGGGAAAVTFGAGTFVACGDNGAMASSDGVTWSNVTSQTLRHIAYGGGQFVALGVAGSYAVSADGTNWITRQIGTVANLDGIVYGNGTFVVFGGDTNLWTSANAVNWIHRTVTTNLTAIGYGNGRFVASGFRTFTSPDGLNWTDKGKPPFNTPIAIQFANGLILALGFGTIHTSIDGETWADQSWGAFDYFNAGTAGGGVSVVVTGLGKAYSSIDGANWTGRNVNIGANGLSSVAFGRNTFVAVGRFIVQSGSIPDPPDSGQALSIGLFPGLTITGRVGRAYRIDFTTDPWVTTNWQPIATILLPSSPYRWTDFTSTNQPRRFYRSVLIP